MPHIQRRRTGYKTHKTILWFISILSLSTTSCEWDETVYKDFVTENGETITITQCPGLDETGQPIDGILSYIEYVKIENDKPVTLTCHADACRSEDNCCSMDDSVLRRQFSNGFVHNLCPANYRCSTNYDTKEYYCTTQKESVCDEEETKCGDKCYNLNNDENHCGDCAYVCSPESLDAEYAEGEKRTATVQCLNGQCHANTCQTGYHTEKDKDQIQRCVPDNAENCHGINCNLLAGCQKNNEDNATSETDGHCYCGETNLCKAERCELGYHTYNENGVPCLADTDTACGPDKINCNDKSKWSDEEKDSVGSKYCYQGNCAISTCDNDYHFNNDNTKCEEDELEYCGSYNNNCTKLAGWKSGECKEGECHVTSCSAGFHKFETGTQSTCELNDNTNCNKHDAVCSAENHLGASKAACDSLSGECQIRECSMGYYQITDNSGNIQCLENDFNNCGTAQYSCQKDGIATGSCAAPYLCNADTCEEGYFKYKFETINGIDIYKCEINNESHCGNYETKCSGDTPYCLKQKDGNNYSCQNLCTQPMETCGTECVNLSTSLTHCGQCNNDCTTIAHASVRCTNNACEILFCEVGYHKSQDKNECVKDTAEACGVALTNCNDDSHQKPNAIMKCENANCSYTCQPGYGDCDGSPTNGCETALDNYGLVFKDGQCVCSDEYLACGETIIETTRIPLCLKQGNYYKNYALRSSLDLNNSCTKYGWRAITLKINNKNAIYCFDKCSYINGANYSSYCTENVRNNLTYVQYYQVHHYEQLSDHWNSELLEWNEANCIQACNTGWGHGFTSSGIESWGHTCDPKQTCDMFDSVEYTGENTYSTNAPTGKLYIDYGCTY